MKESFSFRDSSKPSIAVILDDHSLFAESFAVFLEKTGLFTGVYAFDDDIRLTSFFLHLPQGHPVYLFLDYYLKEKTGLPLINDLRRIYKPISVIMLSSMVNPLLIEHLLSHSIDGFLSKSSDTSEVIECMRFIHQKRRYVSPKISEMRLETHSDDSVPFTAREIEILALFSQGLSVNETAEKMTLSRHTIVSHRRKMMAKAQADSITNLLAFARKLDLI